MVTCTGAGSRTSTSASATSSTLRTSSREFATSASARRHTATSLRTLCAWRMSGRQRLWLAVCGEVVQMTRGRLVSSAWHCSHTRFPRCRGRTRHARIQGRRRLGNLHSTFCPPSQRKRGRGTQAYRDGGHWRKIVPAGVATSPLSWRRGPLRVPSGTHTSRTQLCRHFSAGVTRPEAASVTSKG